MRFSPTKLLHGLLCSTPLLVLVLAACGGGGGSSDASLGAAYTVGGSFAASSVPSGLVLRNNGGDDLSISSAPASYVFATSVFAGKPYHVTVLTQPSSLYCSVANDSGTMGNFNVIDANVSCATAYTIGGGSITGLTNSGLVLQNNGGDNLLIPAGSAGPFTFATPMISGASYAVTILTQPNGLQCSLGSATGPVGSSNVTGVTITCTPASLATADPYVYAANYGSTGANVSVFTSASGVLTTKTAATAGNGPSAIAIAGGKYAYVTNSSDHSISGFSIASGALTALADVDAGTVGPQTSIATGSLPYAIAIHPSGKFAYVANYNDNSISAYSIDAASGALASIDADGATGTQTSIATPCANSSGCGPVSIAITPDGLYAYVANAVGNNITAFSINQTSGALTPIITNAQSGTDNFIGTNGVDPYSVTVDPSGAYLYVVNGNYATSQKSPTNTGGYAYAIQSSVSTHPGSLLKIGSFDTGDSPHAVAVNPNGSYVYEVNSSSTSGITGNSIWVFDIDGITGALSNTPSATTQIATGTTPLAISVDSSGKYVYVTNVGSGDISVYDTTTNPGGLTAVPCVTVSGVVCNVSNGVSNFMAGTSPYGIATSR